MADDRGTTLKMLLPRYDDLRIVIVPQALYSVGIDPNKLEIALSNAMVDDGVGGR